MRTPPQLWAALFMVGLALVTPSQARAARTTVAVLYFDNNSGDAKYDVLSKGLADMIITDLSSVRGLTLVERGKLQAILAEHKLQRSKLVDKQTAVRVGKLLGARYAVAGAVAAVSPKMRIDIRLIEVETAKIVTSAKVIGAEDKFFELQKDLVGRFAKGLGKALPADVQNAGTLKNVLAYSRSLDHADKGDFKLASSTMAKVMSRSPRFKLAKTRYREFLRRLYAAKKNRHEQLGSSAQTLMRRIDAALAGDLSSMGQRDLQKHIGYRVLRGTVMLANLQKVVGAKKPFYRVKLTRNQIPPAKTALQRYIDNRAALVAAVTTAQRRGMKRAYDFVGRGVADSDVTAAKELGTGSFPHHFAFLSPHRAASEGAKFICTGRGDVTKVALRLSPTPAALSKRWRKLAFDWFTFALKDIAANGRYKERDSIRVLDAWGDCLEKLGRTEDAMAKWQQILDTWPKTTEFPAIEKKIKKALGVN